MTSAQVSFFIEEDNFEIPFVSIKSFRIFSSIFSSYPYGEIVLDDPEGRYLTYLAITLGSTLRIEIIPQAAGQDGIIVTDANKKITLGKFKVVGIQNPGVLKALDDNQMISLGSLGGDIVLQLAHPWELFSDYSNRSFKKKGSAIIRELLQNSRRGFTFSSTQLKIDESDDEGSIIRFKLGESEAQFIHQKVLPYTTIGLQPAYSFIDELGTFHLHNFKNMFNASSKALIIPPITEGFSGLLSKSDAKFTLLPIKDGSWGIGRKFTEQLGKMKKFLYVEDPTSRVTFLAKLDYTSTIPGYVLVKNTFVTSVASGSGATEANIVPFREFEDAVRLDINDTAVMDEFFEIEITTDLSVDCAIVGTPVELKLAGDPPNTKHWASGKWLITQTEHFTQEGNYFSKLFLARPSISDFPSTVDKSKLYKSS